ncbi:hypothetical protein LCGC14_0736370 [marine sediment metagenome]|uniref:Uncharacterized protein n=1 Tax=marine sediment metagenome TaxID=412755 RepID=A0A0F9QC76_9ZZZZ
MISLEDYAKIGPYTKRALVGYVLERDRPEPGGFLHHVLCNDLKGTIRSADDTNIHAIPAIMAWLYNYAAPSSYGSPERYLNWLRADTPAPTTCDVFEGIKLLGEIPG